MRDGAILYFVFNISFLPISIMATSYYLWSYSGVTPEQVILIILVSGFIYIGGIGFMCEKISSFLYVDNEPDPPPDFSECSYTCPHCNARYYYGSEIPNNGMITCQNCARDFPVN